MNNPKYLIVHHTGGIDSNPRASTQHQTFAEVNEYHRIKWDFKSSLGLYCGYHFVIDKYGNVFQARADNDEGAHCIGYNLSSIGICCIGNFDTGVDTPTQAQVDALADLLKAKQAQYNIPLQNIVPHRAFAQKTCYGSSLPDTWAQNRLNKVIPPEKYQELQELQERISLLQALLQKLMQLLRLRQLFGKLSGSKEVCN